MRIEGPDGAINVEVPSDAQLIYSGDTELLITSDGAYEIAIARQGLSVWVSKDGVAARFVLPELASEVSEKDIRAPMTARVVTLPIAVGDFVKSGDTLAILEAMKMEYRLEADMDGRVSEIGTKVGELVDLGQLLVRLE